MLDTIESAIGAIKNGQLVIVVDDEDRENEGDFIGAVATITPEIINFMATHGRGLICAPLPEERCIELNLPAMVNNNTSLHETAFTVSVDLLGQGCSTGISAYDRAKTIEALNNPITKPSHLGRPGHIFPLRSKKGGVLSRVGHTEAATDLARLAGFPYPYGSVLVEIINDDGTMARLPDLRIVAKKFNLKLISIKDLIDYRVKFDSIVEEIVRIKMPTKFGEFTLVAFKDKYTNIEHLALMKGEWEKEEPVLTYIHASGFTEDVLSMLSCDYEDSLQNAMKILQYKEKGIIVYINQEESGTKLLNKLKVLKSGEKEENAVTNPSLFNQMDEKIYASSAQILHQLNVSKLRLLNNHPDHNIDLSGYGLEIVERVINDDKIIDKRKNQLSQKLEMALDF